MFGLQKVTPGRGRKSSNARKVSVVEISMFLNIFEMLEGFIPYLKIQLVSRILSKSNFELAFVGLEIILMILVLLKSNN